MSDTEGAEGVEGDVYHYFFYDGRAYHVPESYMNRHPGGAGLMIPYINKDMTKAYDDADHSSQAMRILKKYRISMTLPEMEAIMARAEEGDGGKGNRRMIAQLSAVVSAVSVVASLLIYAKVRAPRSGGA